VKSIRKKTPTGKHIVVLVATEDEIEMLIETIDAVVIPANSTRLFEHANRLGDFRADLVRARYGDEPSAA
jgi:hypothetical protein